MGLVLGLGRRSGDPGAHRLNVQRAQNAGCEILAALFEIVILVKTGRRRGQQNRIAGICLGHRASNGGLHIGAHLGLGPPRLGP